MMGSAEVLREVGGVKVISTAESLKTPCGLPSVRYLSPAPPMLSSRSRLGDTQERVTQFMALQGSRLQDFRAGSYIWPHD
jgi:hypothetical protein